MREPDYDALADLLKAASLATRLRRILGSLAQGSMEREAARRVLGDLAPEATDLEFIIDRAVRHLQPTGGEEGGR